MINLLYVEDDDDWIGLLQDAVGDWNKANVDRPFVLTVAKTIAEAQHLLAPERFDCALLDLKLPSGAGPKVAANGSDLAVSTLHNFGIPVAVLSGLPEDRADELKKQKLVRAFVKKGGAETDVVAWFGGQWDMMVALRSARRQLSVRGAEIFVRRIWPRWEKYKGLGVLGAPVDKIITRQFAAHIAELLGTDANDNPDWHPLENYINPALLDHRAHTGDLFRLDEGLWVVLTPQCDMANSNIKQVLLAFCDPAPPADWDKNLKRLADDPKHDKALRYFRDHVNQNVGASRHFLAPLEDNPLMVDFKALRLEPIESLNTTLDTSRVASIAPPFLSNLTQRFGAYMARPGQPNIGVQHFADKVSSTKSPE